MGVGLRVLSRSAILKNFPVHRVIQRCSDICIVLYDLGVFHHFEANRSLGEEMMVTALTASTQHTAARIITSGTGGSALNFSAGMIREWRVTLSCW